MRPFAAGVTPTSPYSPSICSVKSNYSSALHIRACASVTALTFQPRQ